MSVSISGQQQPSPLTCSYIWMAFSYFSMVAMYCATFTRHLLAVEPGSHPVLGVDDLHQRLLLRGSVPAGLVLRREGLTVES